jgi:hypothetical protein
VRKIIIWTIVIILVIASFVIYWNYYNTYSEGNRSGLLQKFSRKGNLFKTYEGELIMSSIASTGNATLASEKFYFSVKNDSLAKILFDLEGKKVTVHYEQKRNHIAWNGDTEYIVTGVKREE